MAKKENIESARALFEYCNAQDLEAIDALHAPGYTTAYFPGMAEPLNAEQNRMMLQGWFLACPDMSFEVTLQVAGDEHVVTHWVGGGTQTGPMHTPSAL